MSDGLNRVTLFGNLGADPELRTLPNGSTVLEMRLATNHSWMNKDHVREERVEWHCVSMWGARGEALARILKKGSRLLVEGQIRTSTYEKEGEKRYFTRIHADNVILAGRRSDGGARPFYDELPEIGAPEIGAPEIGAPEIGAPEIVAAEMAPPVQEDPPAPSSNDGDDGAAEAEPRRAPPPPRTKKARSPSPALAA